MNPDDDNIYLINKLAEQIHKVKERIFDIIEEKIREDKSFDIQVVYLALLEMSESLERALIKDERHKNFTEEFVREIKAKVKEIVARDSKRLDEKNIWRKMWK